MTLQLLHLQLLAMMHRKLHEYLRQSSLLPLLMNKAKITHHLHAFDLNDTKCTGCQFFADRAN